MYYIYIYAPYVHINTYMYILNAVFLLIFRTFHVNIYVQLGPYLPLHSQLKSSSLSLPPHLGTLSTKPHRATKP